jgi:hypothetical protein
MARIYTRWLTLVFLLIFLESLINGAMVWIIHNIRYWKESDEGAGWARLYFNEYFLTQLICCLIPKSVVLFRSSLAFPDRPILLSFFNFLTYVICMSFIAAVTLTISTSMYYTMYNLIAMLFFNLTIILLLYSVGFMRLFFGTRANEYP